jgi:lysyl-tRNA synthetase class 2
MLDLTPPWREVPYHDLVREQMGDDWFDLSLDDAKSKAKALELDIEDDWNMGQVTHEIYEKVIERTLLHPTFVTRLPAELVPLAKHCEDDPSLVDVFELEIGGKEIAPGYSELNNPLEQRKRLEERADDDAGKIDEEFLTALEHGMPPAGGMGLGIDRLIMVLSRTDAIRDVILFPQLRQKS